MLNKGKHIVKEIEGVRCTVIETGINENRLNFLKGLLQFNKFEVKTEADKIENETGKESFTIGVTNCVFNPVIAVYERALYTKEGNVVTPAYWNQQPVLPFKSYWEYREKLPISTDQNTINPSGYKTV